MKVRALRGVCVGVEQHLKAGDTHEIPEASLVKFLTGIGAVEIVKDEPVTPPVSEPKSTSEPEKSGKKEK